MELNIPAIRGIGGSLIYLVDRASGPSIYDIDFEPLGDDGDRAATGAGLTYIDHLTHNVFQDDQPLWQDSHPDQ
jgi:4-hydroxyphenylpyruvate dioxygenase